MVAPNTQLFHLPPSNGAQPTSSKNCNRVQLEVQKEGREIHKENLSSFSMSKSKKHHHRAGQKPDSVVPLGRRHLPMTTTAATPGLSKRLPCERVTSSSRRYIMPPHEEEAYFYDSRSTSSPGIAEVISSALHSQAPAENPINAHKLSSDMFPHVSACNLVEPEPRPAKFMKTEHVKILPGSCNHADDQNGHTKRLKYISIMETDTSIRSFDVNKDKSVEHGSVVDTTSNCVDGIDYTWKGSEPGNEILCKKPSLEQSPDRACAAVSSPKTSTTNMTFTASDSGMHATHSATAPPLVGLKLFTTTAHAQMPTVLLTLSEGEPSLPPSLENPLKLASSRIHKTPVREKPCSDADWGKFLALSATPNTNAAAETTRCAGVLPFQQRFTQLQAFLKQCDEADQDECMMQALRSLSAAARSGHAVELETRAISLSLEEGNQMKRMRLLNVLGKISERNLNDAGATPHGPRLPAPGATSKLKIVL